MKCQTETLCKDSERDDVTYRDTPSEEVAQNTVRRYFFAQLRSIFPTDVRQSPFLPIFQERQEKKQTSRSILTFQFSKHYTVCVYLLGTYKPYVFLPLASSFHSLP